MEEEQGTQDRYTERYTAMSLATQYGQGRAMGWPNLKQLADQIDGYLRTGK